MRNQHQPMRGADLAQPCGQDLCLSGWYELIATAVDNECGDSTPVHIGCTRAEHVRLRRSFRGTTGKGLEIVRTLDPVWIPPWVGVREQGRQIARCTYRNSAGDR